MLNTQEITLDTDRGSFKSFYAKQGDNKSRQVKVKLLSKGQQIKPSVSEKAVFRFIKPDGKSGMHPAKIEADGSITVTLTDQVLAVSGIVYCDVSIINGNSVISSGTFSITVDAVPVSENQLASSNEFLYFKDASKEAKAAAERANTAADKAEKVIALKIPTASVTTIGGGKVAKYTPEYTEPVAIHPVTGQFVVKKQAGGGVLPPDPGTDPDPNPEPEKPTPQDGDTTAVIEFPNSVLYQNKITSKPSSAWGVTKIYNLPNKVSEKSLNLVYYFEYESDDTYEYTTMDCLTDGVYSTYFSAKPQNVSTNPEKTPKEQGLVSNWGDFNQLRFCLDTARIDESYAYIKQTGEVLFAGKNTPYYGYANIDGTPAGIKAEPIAYKVDRAYAMNGLSTGDKQSFNPAAYPLLSEEYLNNIVSSYNAMMNEINGDFNKIPIIVHTDPHGREGAEGEGGQVLKFITRLVNWYEISKMIQLGDVCVDAYEIPTLESYEKAMEEIPKSKRVEVYGNHDVWCAEGDIKLSLKQRSLSKYFKNIYARRNGNMGYFTVKDDYYNVKYLVASDFEYRPDSGAYFISKEQADFIVNELSKEDGYDIILLSHVPILADETLVSRDPNYYDYTELFINDPKVAFGKTYNDSLINMLSNRRNKGKGIFLDSDGNEHPYDFTNLKSDYLMSLHGHAHFEAYKTWDTGLTEFIFDWFSRGLTFAFGYIDRKARKFKTWKIESDVSAVEPLEINI